MRPGARLLIATDVEAYAAHARDVATSPAARRAGWRAIPVGTGEEKRGDGGAADAEGAEAADLMKARGGLGAAALNAGAVAVRPAWRPSTRYERSAVEAGVRVHDLCFEWSPPPSC